MAGSVPRAAGPLFESLNGRPRHRENQIRGLAPKGSLFPPVRRPRCRKAKWRARDHPPPKWQDRTYGHRQLGHPRHGASPFPRGGGGGGSPVSPSQGSPRAPPRGQASLLPAACWSWSHPAPPALPPSSLAPLAAGSLPGNPTLKNSRPCMLLDQALFLWDRLCTSL